MIKNFTKAILGSVLGLPYYRAQALKGKVFNGRYTVLEKIGAGGMATVYRAKDESTSGFVAVKILSREFLARSPKEAERNLRRFKREAEILRLLAGCPHVVGFVEHACSEAGDWFILVRYEYQPRVGGPLHWYVMDVQVSEE
ncbi:MAG: hypothetical protein AAB356_07740 [Deltaproteobacteria bacterium]